MLHICTVYIAHTAHLFLHTFCIYNEVYNQSITDYLYNRYAYYSIDYTGYTNCMLCVKCVVYSLYIKNICTVVRHKYSAVAQSLFLSN